MADYDERSRPVSGSIEPRREMCSTCPFQRSGDGARLRMSLDRARRREIVAALAASGSFSCHSEIDYETDTTGRQCAGAWSAAVRADVWGQAMRWADRLGTDVAGLAALPSVDLGEFVGAGR